MLLKALGSKPRGKRLERILSSPNYKNGSFQNLSPTEVMLKDASFFEVMRKFIAKPKTTIPSHQLKPVHTDLRTLTADTPVIVWFGHSSYCIKSRGLTVLVDPVFSGNASPVSAFAKAFPGADAYSAADFDMVDMLIITHDHYDHLDYKTIKELEPKIKKICTSLGVGAHLEYWGIEPDKITELDWWESASPLTDVSVTATPARHFSGRGIKRGLTLWSSFVLNLHGHNIYIGGDSGYDDHFKKIGSKYGPFEIALLETGQYGDQWPQIHMKPEEAVQAAIDLRTSVMMPVHWGKFALSIHDWQEPIRRAVAEAHRLQMPLTTPAIGQPVVLNADHPETEWWEQK
ncbi:MAG: MBL fold metallo-hydrolase [Sphingobacteriales bacterium]|nr:MAG: MBL fold metallo-hydrolase [Sphingobacteriales bacterium]